MSNRYKLLKDVFHPEGNIESGTISEFIGGAYCFRYKGKEDASTLMGGNSFIIRDPSIYPEWFELIPEPIIKEESFPDMPGAIPKFMLDELLNVSKSVIGIIEKMRDRRRQPPLENKKKRIANNPEEMLQLWGIDVGTLKRVDPNLFGCIIPAMNEWAKIVARDAFRAARFGYEEDGFEFKTFDDYFKTQQL